MPSHSPEDRSQIARIGAYESWAATSDRSARTAPARRAAMDRFLQAVDPAGALPEHIRQQRAEAARRAFYVALSRKGNATKKARAAARKNVNHAAKVAELRAQRSA